MSFHVGHQQTQEHTASSEDSEVVYWYTFYSTNGREYYYEPKSQTSTWVRPESNTYPQRGNTNDLKSSSISYTFNPPVSVKQQVNSTRDYDLYPQWDKKGRTYVRVLFLFIIFALIFANIRIKFETGLDNMDGELESGNPQQLCFTDSELFTLILRGNTTIAGFNINQPTNYEEVFTYIDDDIEFDPNGGSQYNTVIGNNEGMDGSFNDQEIMFQDKSQYAVPSMWCYVPFSYIISASCRLTPLFNVEYLIHSMLE